jgi:hypothetical protein
LQLKTAYLILSQLSVLIPAFAGVNHYKVLTRPFRILFYFFVISMLFEILGEITRRVYQNNMPGQHAFTLVEFLAFSMIYFLHIQKNSLARYLIGINAVIFIAIAVADALYISSLKDPNDLSRGYSSAFITVYTLGYFYYLFQKDDIRYIWEYPMFWVCTGALVYFAGNALYSMFKSYLLIKAADIEGISHLGHTTLNIIANCLYAQSFQCLGKQKTAP